MHEYWNENTFNGFLHFFVIVVKLEFHQISFLAYQIFIPFTRNWLKCLFWLYFLEYWGISQENEDHYRISHCKNKNVFNFYAFTVRIELRNMSETREFRQKNRAKPSRNAHFANFLFKNPLHLLKNKKTVTDFLL